MVDDGSDDGTADVARAAGAAWSTAGPPRRAGSASRGPAQSGPTRAPAATHLLFLDADTWLAPDGVGRLLASHRAAATGLLSVQPLPPHRAALRAAVGGLQRRVDAGQRDAFGPAGRARPVVAFGPCLFTPADGAAARVGGFAAVRGEVVEDVALARAYRRRRPSRVRASAAARRCASACTRTASARSSRAGPRTWRRAPERRRGSPSLGAVLWVAAAAAASGALAVDGWRWLFAGAGAPVARWSATDWSLRSCGGCSRRLGSFHWLDAGRCSRSRSSPSWRSSPLGRRCSTRAPGGAVARSADRRRHRERASVRLPLLAPGARSGMLLVVDVAAWAVVHAGTGYVVHRLPGRTGSSTTRGCFAPAGSSAAAASTSDRCTSAAGRTTSPRPARSSRRGVEAPPAAGRPRWPRALRRRDPPGRVRPLARRRRRPAVRALEPAVGSRS